MPVVAFDALEWHSAAMPGSNGPVELARLPQQDDHALRAFVRFPAGWSRPGAGHYMVPEEFLILDGDLSLNGITWETGGYAWIPALRVRSGTHSGIGCLAFAWFGGVPRWITGEPATVVMGCDVRFTHWRAAPETSSGSGAYALRADPEHSTWIIEPSTSQPVALPDEAWETLRLHDNTWSWKDAVDPVIECPGLLLVRAQSAFASAMR